MKSNTPTRVARVCACLAAMLLSVAVFGSAQAASASRSNNNGAGVDGSSINRTVTFGAGAFPSGATIDDVEISIDFEKISGVSASACPQEGGGGHGGGFGWNNEIYFGLRSPEGTRVVLVDDDSDTGGSGRGPSYTFIDYGGPVSVDFMEGDLLRTVGGIPESGDFEPEQLMPSFWGENPVGTWTLEISDNFSLDPLCFDGYTLMVSASSGFEIGPEMSSSFFDPDYLGSGINTEILAMPTAAKNGEKGSPGVVLVYWYSYDIFGAPIFAFGVGTFMGDTMTVDFFMDYDLVGPAWGPSWDPDEFEGTPFASAEIVWSDCIDGVMTFTMAPAYQGIWLTYVMNLTRITNVVGLPICI